ncbi:MAG: hypothetical protein ACRDJN_13365 [Chloroflexota bacterium]
MARWLGLLGGAMALLFFSFPVQAQAQAPCRFVLGFATLRDLIGPDVVGDCLEDQRFNPANGNAEQRTTRGLLVWRKADNWTAFTDGYHTWLNGPDGLAQRLNTERFAWERDPLTTATTAAPPAPTPLPIPTQIPTPAQATATPSSGPAAGVEISQVSAGWEPPGAAVVFPVIRFTITNRSGETLPIYDDRLHYSADFLDTANRQSYGSGLGVAAQVGLDGLRPSYGDEIEVRGNVAFRRSGSGGEPAVPPQLTVELYQGNALAGNRRHIGTYQITRPAP